MDQEAHAGHDKHHHDRELVQLECNVGTEPSRHDPGEEVDTQRPLFRREAEHGEETHAGDDEPRPHRSAADRGDDPFVPDLSPDQSVEEEPEEGKENRETCQ